MLKKFLSFAIIIAIISSNTVYAFEPFSWKPNLDITNVNVNLESIYLSNLGNKTFKVNLQDITSDNAGKVVKFWQGKNTFPDKLVLEQGFNIEIDKIELEKVFVRTSDLKSKVASAKSGGTDIGEVTISEPTLKLLPDRLQLSTDTVVKFRTNAQLRNIKSKLGIGLDVAKDQELNISLANLTKNQKTAAKNKREELNKDFIKGVNDSVQKMDMDVDKAMLAGLVKVCQKEKGKNSADCTMAKVTEDLNTHDKVIKTNETQEFSLLPPNVVLGGTGVIMMEPSQVRLSRSQMLDIYKQYGSFLLSNTGSGGQNNTSRPSLSNETNPYEQANYCSIISGGDKAKITECEKLLKEKNEAKEKVYKQDLLNGFTLGEAQKYHWDDSIRIDYVFDSKKLASASIDFAYNYGFGIRIPIQTEIKIDKSIVDDWENNSKYDIYVKAKTSDAPKSYYSRVGLPEEKTFNGNEFVFELGSTLDIKARVVGDIIDINKHFKLVSLLAELLKANGESFFGIEGTELDDVIKNNGFKKSKNFKPPFAGEANIPLFSSRVDVPIYQIPNLFKLVASIFTDVKLNGIIKSQLTQINSTECKKDGTNNSCPDKITFDTTEFKKYNAKAVFNRDSYQENALGQYSNYGIELSNFKYIPELIFEVFVQGKASVKVPILGWESYTTPKIKVFKMTLSSDDIALGTHDGTIGTASAKENMVYATNPKIDLQTPLITKMGDNDRATFEVTNNKSPMIKTYFTTDGTNPNCNNIGEAYSGTTKLWKEPYKDLVSNKTINLKVISCTIFGEASQIKTKTLNLRNDSFKFSFSPKISANMPKIDSDRKIEILDSDYLNKLTVRYTTDGSNPTCNSGNMYNYATGFTLNEMGKTRLVNDFPAVVKGIACNSQGRSLNQIMTENYTVHNKYYNPSIRLEPRVSISFPRHENTNRYTTSVKYTADGTEPTCLIGLSVVNGGEIFFAMGGTIKAVTCITEKVSGIASMQEQYNTNVVFKSDVVSRTTENPIEGGRFDNIGEQLRYRLKGQLDDRIFRAFGDFGYDDFENQLNTGIDEGSYSIGAIRGLGGLLSDGEMSQFGLVQIGKMYNGLRTGKITTTQFNSQMNNLITTDEISANGARSLSSLMKNGSLTRLQIENIAGSIETHFDSNNINLNSGRQNNFRQTTRYSGNSQNNSEEEHNGPQATTMGTTLPTNDGVQRKFAQTKMNGCGENDIVMGNRVWASCNSDYNITNSVYYNWTTTTYTNGVTTTKSYELDTNSKDINGWKYGRQYSTTNVECPAGYRVPSYYDFSESLNAITDLQILKLPSAGYKPSGNGGFREKDSMGAYHVSWLPITNPPTSYFFYTNSVSGDSAGHNDGYNSLRCIRIEPATDSEKGINNGNTNTGSANTGTYNKPNSESTTSSDPYINEKLEEINSCFVDNYTKQLASIDAAITKITQEKEKQSSDKLKSKYDAALNKMKEIRRLFILKYSSIINTKDNNLFNNKGDSPIITK